MSGFGYNNQQIIAGFEEHYKRAKLKGGLFYAEKTDFNMLNRLYNNDPSTKIVIRNWPDADQHMRFTPQQWLNTYGWQSYGGRFYVGASNESNWSPELLSWTLELCKKTVAMKGLVKICIINLNSGHNVYDTWAEAHEILKLACDYPDWIKIGLHEYAGGVILSGLGGNPDGTLTVNGNIVKQQYGVDYTVKSNRPTKENLKRMTKWHCGRFEFLQDYCYDHFGKWPAVILTEHGFDFLSDISTWLNSLPRSNTSINGFKSLREYWARIFPGVSPEDAYWEQLVYADQNIYDGTCVEVQIIFSMGFNPDWVNYEVGDWIFKKVEAYNTGKPQMTVVPLNGNFKVVIAGGGALNVRPDMSTKNTPLGGINSGTIVFVVEKYLQSNNNWCKINFAGKTGFISLLTNASNVDSVKLEASITPPVETPPSETNWQAIKVDLSTAILKLQSVVELIPE